MFYDFNFIYKIFISVERKDYYCRTKLKNLFLFSFKVTKQQNNEYYWYWNHSSAVLRYGGSMVLAVDF